ncbi:MAG: SAM-dependent methyltransferase [Acidimicrobiales bacterium]
MLSVLRYHEISESSHRIMNPLSLDELLLLGDICRVGPGTRLLDLACGKGELLCQFARRLGASGVGVDVHAPFLVAARERAAEFGVADSVGFIEGDAGHPTGVSGRFDVVSCIGATWVGGGLSGTLDLMSQWLAPHGWLLVGEAFWAAQPPDVIRRKHEDGQTFADLAGTLDCFEAAHTDLVEMVLATPGDWDRYEASQWLNVAEWLSTNAHAPEASEVRAQRDASRRDYLTEERRCLGWGVFVLRAGKSV